jgi:hypothetical protein
VVVLVVVMMVVMMMMMMMMKMMMCKNFTPVTNNLTIASVVLEGMSTPGYLYRALITAYYSVLVVAKLVGWVIRH